MNKIVIIDDSPSDQEWLSELLQDAGDFSVECFSSGAEGIRHLEQHQEDCVLIDYRLDGEDGLAVLTSLKSSNAVVPAILMTGEGSEELAITAIKAGASRYLTKKGLTGQVLVDAVSGAIRDGRQERKNADSETSSKHVLLIEDNDEDREAIAEMILSANVGATVRAVATGTEALAEFDTHGADCVILDYRLEVEDGLDVLDALKQRSRFTPVIMLTGQGNEEVAAKSIRVGAADYLVKQRLNQTYLRTAVENAISRAALEAKVADQEAQRRQFLSILVHDLRAPLRNVRQLGDIAIEGAEEGDVDGMKDALTSQKAVSARAADLISTLETYALLDGDVPFTRASLTDVAEAARDNLANVIIDRQADIVIHEMPDVEGNVPQLTQLLQNLIVNGLKYNKSEQPEISIESDGVGEGEESVCIVVKDNGIGIPSKHLETIFSPLKRLWRSEEYEGTGLGLAICQKIAERHGGKIWCTAIEGEGSQFHIRFPLPTVTPVPAKSIAAM